MCAASANDSVIPFRVQAYVNMIVDTFSDSGKALVSVVLFGSAAIGGWMETVSDVDLVLVVPDSAISEDIDRLYSEVERIEILHGLRTHSAHGQPALEQWLDRVTANVRSFFICTRSDLLTGNIGRILRLHPAQTLFVDRIVLANILSSGITVWGEAILPLVPVPPLRRFDVFKALLGLFPAALLCAAVFPLHPAVTRYAMGVLKRSLHSCFFCYELRRASLQEEVSFFERRLGSDRTLRQLLDLRREYRNSFTFVILCIPTLMRLNVRTSIDNRFPREAPKQPARMASV